MAHSFKNIEILLFDIEGTVCPISFVKDKLFPYFINKCPEILKQLKYPLAPQSGSDDLSQINNIVLQFSIEFTKSYEYLIRHLINLVDHDIKDVTLKSLQGFIWKLGYENGEIKAPVYSDAIDLIKSFKGKKYIYSSGSIKAQKLLFAYVESGSESIDLNPFLSGYFDITTSGFKQQSTSYESILKDIGYSESPEKVLFLTDNVDEVKAAKSAKLNSIIVNRPGNYPITSQDIDTYGVIEDFKDLVL